MVWSGVARARPSSRLRRRGLRFGGRKREVVLRTDAAARTRSRSPGQYAHGPTGTEEQRGRSAHPEQQRCAAHLREQTRPPRRRRFCSCRGRSCLGTSWSPDAGTPRTWCRDTRPCTAGWRFVQMPASARSKRELLETRDARHPQGQELRQPEKVGTPGNPDLFKVSPPPARRTCGFSPVAAENPAGQAGRFNEALRGLFASGGTDAAVERGVALRTLRFGFRRRTKPRSGRPLNTHWPHQCPQ